MSVYISGKESVDGVHTSHFSPCGKCKDTCFLLHDYLPADCPLQTCDVCSTIAAIDEDIYKTEKLLFNLAKKRQDAKRRINSRHDRLFGRLPVEVVSRVFRAVAEPHTGKVHAQSKPKYKWSSTALLLGAVCKGWRDITLGTPHLWTTISINLWKDSSNPDVVKEWLNRSRALPLTVIFLGFPPRHQDGLEGLGRLLKVVRSHSARWRNVTSQVSWDALHALFHQLKDVPEIEYLSVDLFARTTAKFCEMPPASLAAPLCPTDYITSNFSSEKILFEWHNLTRLRAFYITVDELVHIVRCASGLTECAVNLLMDSKGRFPLPTIPIRHESLKILDAGNSSLSEDFLHHFTFPSLQNLDYTVEDDNSIYIFSSFLMRSAVPLSNFTLRCSMSDVYDNNPWAQALSAVTHLKVIISEDDPDSSFFSAFDITNSFFRALVTSNCSLPNLRCLEVTTPFMPSKSWRYLADFLSYTENEHTQDASDSGTVSNGSNGQGHTQVSESNHGRPLRVVKIRQTGDTYDDEEPDIGMATLVKFENVQKSGISLDFVDTFLQVNLLDSAARYRLELLGDHLDSDTSTSVDTDSNESASDGFGDYEG